MTTDVADMLRRISALPTVGVIAGEEHRVLEANDAFLHIVGRTRADLESGGIDWTTITPERWHQADADGMAMLLTQGWSPPLVKEYVHARGHTVPVVITGMLVDRHPFRWCSVVVDISDGDAAVRLREAEQQTAFLEGLVGALSESVLILSPVPPEAPTDLRIDHANDGPDVFGVSVDTTVGLLLGDVYPNARTVGLIDAYLAVARTGVRFERRGLRYQDARPGQSQFSAWFDVRASRLSDGRVALAFANVTAQHLQQAELERARVEAAGQQRAIDRLQDLALPSLPTIQGLILAAHHLAADDTDTAVGGDFYDALLLDDGSVALVMGDVAGHGLEAVALMQQLRVAAHATLLAGVAPLGVLHTLDRLVRDPSTANGMATFLLGVIAPDRRTMRWVSAGHVRPVVAGAQASAFAAGAVLPPLGAVHGPDQDHVLPLPESCRLVLVTDGVVERRGESVDVGLGRLLDAVHRTRAATPAEAAELLANLAASPRRDDAAVMVTDLAPRR